MKVYFRAEHCRAEHCRVDGKEAGGVLLWQGGGCTLSYIGGGMYHAEPCPECGAILWNGRCENPDCVYHWHPKTDDGDRAEQDAEDET